MPQHSVWQNGYSPSLRESSGLASADETQRRILPAWEANLRRDEALPTKLAEERHHQIAEVERHRYPMVDWALKSLGRIEVVAAV